MHDGISSMEWALFLEDIEKYRGKKVENYHYIVDTYDKDLTKKKNFEKEEFTYLYFGCEFCEYKIPRTGQMKDFFQICKEERLFPVFVTPVVTDYGISKIQEYLDVLMDENDLSIVVNDYGVLELLYNAGAIGRIIAGRVLDKLSHESRASMQELYQYYGRDGLEYATTPGILSDSHKTALKKYDINRYEFDVPKVGLQLKEAGLHYSLYWPLSYITTGRVCPFRAMDRRGVDKFLVGSPCTVRCKNVMIERRSLTGDMENHKYVLQEGNTIFYINDNDVIGNFSHWFDRMILQVL